MKRTTLFAAAAIATLAGCSGGNADADADGEVSVKEAVDTMQSEGLKPEPGLYKTTVTMTDLQIPGMPPEMAGHGTGMTTTVEDCLTEAEVDKGFEELVKQGQDGECTYERFSMSGGKIDAVLACKAQGRATRMEMSGTTTRTSADLTATMSLELEGAGEGTMKFNARHERIGDCPTK